MQYWVRCAVCMCAWREYILLWQPSVTVYKVETVTDLVFECMYDVLKRISLSMWLEGIHNIHIQSDTFDILRHIFHIEQSESALALPLGSYYNFNYRIIRIIRNPIIFHIRFQIRNRRFDIAYIFCVSSYCGFVLLDLQQKLIRYLYKSGEENHTRERTQADRHQQRTNTGTQGGHSLAVCICVCTQFKVGRWGAISDLLVFVLTDLQVLHYVQHLWVWQHLSITSWPNPL